MYFRRILNIYIFVVFSLFTPSCSNFEIPELVVIKKVVRVVVLTTVQHNLLLCHLLLGGHS
jgi:hypothetical protein